MVEAQLIERLREMAERGMSPPQMARELSVTRQWVYKVCADHGISYNGRGKPLPRVLTGGVRTPINSRIAGSISELLAACDLMARGYQVFMPVVSSTAHDLIAVKGRRCITIEVRSGWRKPDGGIAYARKATSTAHVHAVVITGEPVSYLPDNIIGDIVDQRTIGSEAR